MAFQDAAKKAKPVLLEPIMSVEVVASEKTRPRSSRPACHFRRLFGYATDLRSRTRRCASYSMRFYRYEALHGGPDTSTSDEDRSGPVTAPRAPAPQGKESGVPLADPGD